MNKELYTARKQNCWSQAVVSEMAQVSTLTYSRWEQGVQQPHPHNLDLLCKAFGKSPEELGFELSPHDKGKDDMNRRKMLGLLGAMTGTLLTTSDVLDSDELDRLIRELENPSSLDATALSSLEGITRHNWQLLYCGVPWPALLGGVLGHLQTITSFLKGSHSTSIEQRLYALASQEAQMAGEIYFDMHNYKQAQDRFTYAIKAAQKAENPALVAVAIGRINVRPSHKEQLQKYLSLLQVAHRLAVPNATITTRAWLAAREAEAQANIGATGACYKALEQAEMVSDQRLVGDDPLWTHFSLPSLAGYKGVCYVRLCHPQAQDALLEALTSLPSRKATTLVDLANSYAQSGEVEEACKRAGQALALTEQNKSVNTLQRICDFRPALDTWSTSRYVKDLDQQIAATRTNLIKLSQD
jgi:transcriptional regulator with XRE-family HTH domain